MHVLKRLSIISNPDRKVSSGHGKEHRCGAGACYPSCAQGCANMKAYAMILSLLLILHFVYFSYSLGVMRTVEKRFGLPSYKMGLVMSVSDIAQTVLVLVVGYLGRKTHKPRYLSISALFSAAGILLSAAPYFIYGAYQYDTGALSNSQRTPNPSGLFHGNSTSMVYMAGGDGAPRGNLESQTCRGHSGLNSTYAACGQDGGGSSMTEESQVALYLFFVASLLIGFGTSGLFTLGVSFIDENVKKEDSALYVGIVMSMFAWGPIIGFALAALCTRLPEDLGVPVVDVQDPAFIGCWWLGHVICAVLLVVVAVPMFYFPKHFRAYYLYCKKAPKPKAGNEKTTALKELKAFPKSLWRLLSNPAYMLLAISKVCAMYYIIGVIINQTRYIEVHFRKPAFIANMATGVCGALTGALGNIAGGVLMKRMKLAERGSTVLYAVCLAGQVVCLLLMMLVPCAQPPTAYDGVAPLTELGYDVNAPCNAACNCSRDHYQPICTPEGVEYFSPCYAGCTNVNGTVFTDCSCAPNGTSLSSEWCMTSCDTFIPHIVLYALASLIGGFSGVPVTVMTFRLVEPEMKAFALGVISALHNILVFVPGPIIFGALFDSACLIWKSACGSRMNCMIYDITLYRYYMHGITIAFETGALILAIILCIYIRTRFRNRDITDEKEVERLNPINENNDERGSNTIYKKPPN